MSKQRRFPIQEFKDGLNLHEVLDYIQNHHFVILDLDEATIKTQCMQVLLDDIKLIQRKKDICNNLKLAFIVNQVGDQKFKAKFRRDSEHVWPKALNNIQLDEIGLLKNVGIIRDFTKKSLQKCIHVKLILNEKHRE